MKFIRYVLLVQFLLVLGLLAVFYAAPDLVFQAASAAGMSEAECGGAGCQTAGLAGPDAAAALPQNLLEPEIQNTDASAVSQTALSASAPLEEPDPQSGLDDFGREDMPALRQQQIALHSAPASLDGGGPVAARGISEAVQLDPELVDQAANQGVALEDLLRVQADLNAFVQQVKTGHEGIPRGVFVAGTLSMPIRRQPASHPGFISAEEGVATQFGPAEKYGTIGLLAHNYLAGTEFFNLEEGQRVHLVYGDGEVKEFIVSEIHQYRAGQPNSPYSDFYDLDNGGEKYSAKEIFHMMYNRDGDVVFQTCIEEEGISTWGRLFVIATPV
ncbi:MAG: hypothetical protein R3335_06945 [Anaerolineales bacterium]|nr:hypothetical protein [Anaerolineales bacterium]